MSEDFIQLANKSSAGKLIRVRTDPQKLALRLTLRFQQSAPVTAADIWTVLSELRLSLPDDQQEQLEEFLREFDEEPRNLEEHQIVTGVPPVPGKDAPVHWEVDIRGDDDPPQQDIEQVDHYRVTRFVNVGPGDRIFTLGDVEPGEDGVDILGYPSPAPEGQRYPIESGLNVEYLEDERTLVATEAGAIQLKDDVVSVQPLYQVAGDVDFSVGHIDFVGTVHIQGNVLGGFNVNTGEDLFVGGNIEGATVTVGGNLQVNGGITGHGKARIVVAGNTYAKYINSTSLKVGGEVLVKTEIVNSQVQSAQRITVMNGGIIGGEVIALYEVRTGMLGSQMNVKTKVAVGIGDTGKERIRELDEELEELSAQSRKIRAAVSRFLALPSLLEKLPPEKRAAMKKLIGQLEEMNKLRIGLTTEKQALRQIEPCVVVLKRAFPNVFIHIGADLRTQIGEMTTGPLLYRISRRTRRVEKVRP